MSITRYGSMSLHMHPILITPFHKSLVLDSNLQIKFVVCHVSAWIIQGKKNQLSYKKCNILIQIYTTELAKGNREWKIRQLWGSVYFQDKQSYCPELGSSRVTNKVLYLTTAEQNIPSSLYTTDTNNRKILLSRSSGSELIMVSNSVQNYSTASARRMVLQGIRE